MVYSAFTKSIFRVLLIVLAISATVFAALRLKQVKIPTISLNDTSGQLLANIKTQLDQRETATWQQLAHDTGVTEERCNQIQQQLEGTYQARENEQSHQGLQSSGLSQKTIILIQGILTDFNIAPSSVIVMAMDENDVPAYSDGHRIICINEKELTAYPDDAQKFIIAHELGHIINRHAIQSDALESALQDHQLAHHYTQKFNKMYEIQADATAISHSQEYAQAGMSYLTTYLQRNGNFESPTHPSAHERLAIAQKIHTAFNHA